MADDNPVTRRKNLQRQQAETIVLGKTSAVKRQIITPERGEDGLFIQPHDASAEREVVENHNRQRFASHFNFADPFTGNTRTHDVKGNYNCGRCNQEKGGKCLLLTGGTLEDHKPFTVDEAAGSCEDWENKCAGDPEMNLNAKSPDAASYGVAANGEGFGCHRCPFASKAYKPDSVGRSMYCGQGDFRTFGNACCSINGAPLKESK
jgi:hypothetical protein